MLDRDKIDITKVANVIFKYANDDSAMQINIHRVDNEAYNECEGEEKFAGDKSSTHWKEMQIGNLKVVLFAKRLDERA